ncbi:MAG: ECF-type sigma factor [Acidobacteriota bacterium]
MTHPIAGSAFDTAGSSSLPITQLLDSARRGGPQATSSLLRAVYRELRRTAQSIVGHESKDCTLAATEVVHEAYLRLFKGEDVPWENRRHFFGSAAVAMRRVLIDHARARRSGRRIPREAMVELDAGSLCELPNLDILALDAALTKLRTVSPRQAEIVELRFFSGLTESEIAKLLGLSRPTVSRDWKVARLRLLRDIET